MAIDPTVINQLDGLYRNLKTVDGALESILCLASDDSAYQPSPGDVIGLLQMLANTVRPTCQGLNDVIQKLSTETEIPPRNRSASTATGAKEACLRQVDGGRRRSALRGVVDDMPVM